MMQRLAVVRGTDDHDVLQLKSTNKHTTINISERFRDEFMIKHYTNRRYFTLLYYIYLLVGTGNLKMLISKKQSFTDPDRIHTLC